MLQRKGIILTATVCICLCLSLVLVGSPVKAGDLPAFDREAWLQEVESGHCEYGSVIDAEIVEKDGKKIVKEGHHPLNIPDHFKHVKTEYKNYHDFIEGQDSIRDIYMNLNDRDEFLLVLKFNGIPAVYYYFDNENLKQYNYRASYDADENFEQKEDDIKEDKCRFNWESYYPDAAE